MNYHLPNFNVKNLVKEAGTTLSRVVQLTEEKFGTTERTEYDLEYQRLAEKADILKICTEKIVKNTEAVLVPNPQNRVEDFILEKIDKSKPQRLSNLEYLALDMIEAGGEFGQDTTYSQALIKVGQAEQRLGTCERNFITSSSVSFTQPLRKFLDTEVKHLTKERALLDSKRLDLDACKSRVRKARSMLGQQTKDGISPETVLDQAERDLRVAQSEFDRQCDITKDLLEAINTDQTNHLRHLNAFVGAQFHYYNEAFDIMKQLQNDLVSLGVGTTQYTTAPAVNDFIESSIKQDVNNSTSVATINTNDLKRARVLMSYDAKDHTELTLTANEIIFITECSPPHPDYVYGKQGILKGLAPRAFLESVDDDDLNDFLQ